jgi:ParB family chromosome partitioning protein
MKIHINLIKGSKNPIRTSEDKEKMDELVQSIAQQGLIVPIKVRPLGDEYEVVYGHRRLHACKELGLAEIECIVEGVDDNDQLIQALIENVVREDMSPIETAKALKRLQEETGWSQHEIERKGFMSQQSAGRFLSLLNEDEEIQSLIGGQDGGETNGFTSLTEFHVREVRQTGMEREEYKPVLMKAAKEQLTSSQARKVAEAVKQAETPEERQAILDTPIDNPMFDRIVRAKAKAEIEHKAIEAERHMGNTHEVKEFLDAMKAFEKAISIIMEAIDYKAISPESVQYTVNRLAKVTESINDLTIKLMEAK